jgi:hypothetical protein
MLPHKGAAADEPRSKEGRIQVPGARGSRLSAEPLGCAKSCHGEACLRFDIYGRYQLEVIREGDSWKIYSPGVGTRAPVHSLVVPPEAQPHEIEMWLDDLLHELAEPGRTIRRVG